MIRKLKGGLLAIILLLIFASASKSLAQDISNEGRNFWTVFPSLFPNDYNTSNMKLFITSSEKTKGKVNIGGNLFKEFQVAAGGMTEVNIPSDQAYLGDLNRQTTSKGIQVLVADEDPSVVVYAYIIRGNYSAATLLLPVNGLGSSYYAMGFKSSSKSGEKAHFVFNVVAVTSTTTVLIHQRVDNVLSSTLTITLNHAGDVYQFVSDEDKDYTGTYVEVDPASKCKTFAMFSGNDKAWIGDNANQHYSPLFQQLYATNYWYKKYIYLPFHKSTNSIDDDGNYNGGSILRIIAKEDNTNVTIGDNPTMTLNKGEYYTSAVMATTQIIKADKPISVAQFASRLHNNIGIGSSSSSKFFPNMVMLSPIELGINNITTFLRLNSFINVIIKTAAVHSFRVNGVPLRNKRFIAIAGSPYSYVQLKFKSEKGKLGAQLIDSDDEFENNDYTRFNHKNQNDANQNVRLTANEGFNAICYGWGRGESFAYSAGTNLATDVSLIAIDHTTKSQLAGACENQSLQFKLTLAYPATELQFDLDPKKFTVNLGEADYTRIDKEGIPFYEYSLSPISYTMSGNKRISIKIKVPPSINTDDQCPPTDGYKNFKTDFQVYSIPEAKIGAITESCVNQAINFSDQTSPESGIAQWLWDFGDGDATSNEQNPTHTYKAHGNYTATLTVTTASGCSSSTTQVIKIWALPIAVFTSVTSTCQNSSITFTNTSTSVDGTIKDWDWNFGDGSTTSALSNTTHTYTNPGTYTATLTVTTDKGCISSTTQAIKIGVLPTASFTNSVNTCQNNSISFTNNSTSTDGTIKDWIWDFGDGAITSTKNPTHAYTASGTYTATLTVTTDLGCISSTSQTIRIWALPVADFPPHDIATCQNSPIHFTDASSSADRTITHWYWDFGDGSKSALSNTTHTFSHAGTYPVSLTVETDKGCKSAIFAQNIVIKSFPLVDFEFPKDLCLKDLTITLAFTNTTTITDGSSLTYLWNFSDQYADVANNASALRDPSHVYSKPGTYTVTLSAIAAGGCSTTITHILLIHAHPQPNFTVLNADQLCSSEKVIFEDNASIDFGEITHIDWYYDVNHHPNVKSEDNRPNLRSASTKQYTHQYPIFHIPLTKSYTVKMVAYSAHFCTSEITKTIVLKAAPNIIFDPIPSICVNKGPLSLSTHIIGAATGTWQFKGKGVSEQGQFNPSMAGVGSHSLTCAFIRSDGCSISKTQTVVVHPLPKIHVGGNRSILHGEHIQLGVSAHGNHLTYKWFPATGLNRDDIINPSASPAHDITYTLIATSQDGCTNETKVFVNVAPIIEISNTFTPNGDEVNDTWVIKNLNLYPGATIEVFNRYGAKVFHSEGKYTPWNGKFGGKDLPVGTYYYFINPKNRRNPISGSVTILR